ncbi:MAG: DHHA1 domain-containing protein [Fervidicoccaceae archaeon]
MGILGKWWILSHGDGDGISSAAISMGFLKNEVRGIYFTHPAGLAEDLEIVSKGESVIITDIAFSSGLTKNVMEKLSGIIADGGEVIYIDHHPIPPEVVKNKIPGEFINEECCSASELSYRYLKRRFGTSGFKEREFEKIALYGSISDYLDNTEWVVRALNNWDKRYIYFEAGILSQGLEGMRKQHELKREIVKKLASGEDPSSISELVVNSIFMSRNEKNLIDFVSKNFKIIGKVAYVEEPPGSVPRAATYARALSGQPIGAAFEKRKGMAIISIRASDASFKVNELAMKIAPTLGGNAGGHPLACGARVPLEKTVSFFEAISEAINVESVGNGKK